MNAYWVEKSSGALQVTYKTPRQGVPIVSFNNKKLPNCSKLAKQTKLTCCLATTTLPPALTARNSRNADKKVEIMV